MSELETQIQEMIDRETRAWDEQNAAGLADLFHPDTVWPWPRDAHSHDPVNWEFPYGRYNRARWIRLWQEFFDTYTLVHNQRKTVKIMVSTEGDGAFAVVDIDTLWRDQTGQDFHWEGRVSKGYTLVNGEWKLIFHTGILDYSIFKRPEPRGD
jgi:hypothetical protein